MRVPTCVKISWVLPGAWVRSPWVCCPQRLVRGLDYRSSVNETGCMACSVRVAQVRLRQLGTLLSAVPLHCGLRGLAVATSSAGSASDGNTGSGGGQIDQEQHVHVGKQVRIRYSSHRPTHSLAKRCEYSRFRLVIPGYSFLWHWPLGPLFLQMDSGYQTARRAFCFCGKVYR